MDLKTNEKIMVEKKGSRVPTLLSFMKATRKYANQDHKVLKLSSDDPTVLTEFGSHYPNIHMELLEPEKDAAQS